MLQNKQRIVPSYRAYAYTLGFGLGSDSVGLCVGSKSDPPPIRIRIYFIGFGFGLILNGFESDFFLRIGSDSNRTRIKLPSLGGGFCSLVWCVGVFGGEGWLQWSRIGGIRVVN